MLGVTLDADVGIPMRDQVTLSADVWRPTGDGRLPVLLMRTPYGKRVAQDYTYAHPWWWARRGYAVVVQDSRGRHASEGGFEPFATMADDTVDTVRWVHDQPFCNGRVGMYGFSYPGAAQLLGVVQDASGVDAIAPAMTQADFYEGWSYRNGAFALAFCASWATFLAADVARRGGDSDLEAALMGASMPELYNTLPLGRIPNLGPSEAGGFFSEWLAHPSRDEYWDRWDVGDLLPSADTAVLAVAGLWDTFIDGTIDVYRKVRGGVRADDARLIIGPWYHMPWIRSFGQKDFGPEADNTVSELQLKFFDQWLRDADPSEGSRVRAFISGADTWEDLSDWPPETGGWTLFLGSDGRANSLGGGGYLSEISPGAEEPDVYTYDPSTPVPSLGGRSCCIEVLAPMGPMDQRPVEMMNQVLVYTSPSLPSDRLVMGEIEAVLFVATTALDTDWTIKICDVFPDGRSMNIQESIQRARYAGDPSGRTLTPPGEVAEVRFSAGTCSHLFKAGHSVRVEVSSSNFPQWDRNLNTGAPVGSGSVSDQIVALNAVLHDGDHLSRVVLPSVSL